MRLTGTIRQAHMQHNLLLLHFAPTVFSFPHLPLAVQQSACLMQSHVLAQTSLARLSAATKSVILEMVLACYLSTVKPQERDVSYVVGRHNHTIDGVVIGKILMLRNEALLSVEQLVKEKRETGVGRQ